MPKDGRQVLCFSRIRHNTQGRTRHKVSAYEYPCGADTALQSTHFQSPQGNVLVLLQNPGPLALWPNGSLPTWPSSGSPGLPGRRPSRAADAVPKFSEILLLPTPVLLPSPLGSKSYPCLIPSPTQSHHRPHFLPKPPNSKPRGRESAFPFLC